MDRRTAPARAAGPWGRGAADTDPPVEADAPANAGTAVEPATRAGTIVVGAPKPLSSPGAPAGAAPRAVAVASRERLISSGMEMAEMAPTLRRTVGVPAQSVAQPKTCRCPLPAAVAGASCRVDRRTVAGGSDDAVAAGVNGAGADRAGVDGAGPVGAGVGAEAAAALVRRTAAAGAGAVRQTGSDGVDDGVDADLLPASGRTGRRWIRCVPVSVRAVSVPCGGGSARGPGGVGTQEGGGRARRR